jgi:hypothetical protein
VDTTTLIIIAIVVLLVAVAVVAAIVLRRRKLEERFGPEYERTVESAESRREAHKDLREREERREQFDIEPLSETARQRYRERWEDTQREFVDAPQVAVDRADQVIQDVMRERGYPVEDFEQRASDLSVDHPKVVEHYREGRRCADRVADQPSGEATEEMRQAMLHFRRLFDVLVDDRTDDRADEGDRGDRAESSRRDGEGRTGS